MKTQHKSSLAGVYALCNVRFELMYNDTRQQFVEGITKANWTKLSDQFGISYFWNKDQVCDTPARRDSKVLKDVLNNLNYTWAQTGPVCLEEKSVITIRS